MENGEKLAAAVEREERRRAQRVARDEKVPTIDDARLLSGMAEVQLRCSSETADAIASELTAQGYDFDVASRAIKLSGMPDEVLPMADGLTEQARLTALRARARRGDPKAKAELEAAREAMRRAVQS